MTLCLTNFDTGCDAGIARELDSARNADEYAETVEKNADQMPGTYTVKIVVTMTVDAHNREQAEILAGHIAAFLPEDAARVAKAFTPVIVAPSRIDSRASGSSRGQSAASAEVIMVVSQTPVFAESPRTRERNTRTHAGPVPSGLPLRAPDVRMPARSVSRRISLYTRATGPG